MRVQPKRNLLIRADADGRIGAGHVMRCLGLAQAWKAAGGGAVFLASPPRALKARLIAEGFEVVPSRARAGSRRDAEETEEWASRRACRWVVADGYRFGADFQRHLRDAGRSLLLIDDYGHSPHYFAAMVLNQNSYASERFYRSRETGTRLLLGADYVLLRREFLERRPNRPRKVPEKARNILVTMGGSDGPNATRKVLESLASFRDVEAAVLVGGGNPRFQELSSFARKMSVPVRVEKDVADMPKWMGWADLAIFAGGITSYEMAFMGVPGLTLVLAENQRQVAEDLSARGVIRNLGWHREATRGSIAAAIADLRSSAATRSKMSRRGRELVDGRGARRVSDELLRVPPR